MDKREFILKHTKFLEKKLGNSLPDEEELFTCLERAYIQLQTDTPIFNKSYSLKIEDDTYPIELDLEILEVNFLGSSNLLYEKESSDNYHKKIFSSQNCNMFTSDLNSLFINPKPPIDDVFTLHVKYLKELKEKIELPLLFRESLTLLFFSKVLDFDTTKDYKDLSIHYFKLYKSELMQAKKINKVKHRNVKSNYIKV